MDSKRDIYNLWVQYTTKVSQCLLHLYIPVVIHSQPPPTTITCLHTRHTYANPFHYSLSPQNEETFFRQFIAGFVSIWSGQLNLNLDDASQDIPSPRDIKYDLGPHIKRLPDELIPAIQKFLIIARTNVQSHTTASDPIPAIDVEEIRLLVQCLTIIGRHFDNINLIIRSNFINCTVEICHHLLNVCSTHRLLSADEQSLLRVICEFLELIYDPLLKWRYFTRTHELDSGSGSSYYHVDSQLHPEIVPFVYTCFEGVTDAEGSLKRSALSGLGQSLLNVLGAITSGSLRNSRLVICPATINVMMKILGDWSMEEGVRKRALDNANLMLIMLVKSSPVERQIEVDIVVQEYLRAVQQLLKAREFVKRTEEEQDHLEDSNVDHNALLSIIQNIPVLLREPSTKTTLCHSLLDNGLITQLVEIPEKLKDWTLDMDEHLSSVVEVIALVSYSVNYKVPEKLLRRLFQGIRESSSSGSQKRIVQQCLGLATNPNDALVVNSMVVNELVRWLPSLGDFEQELIIASLMDVCTRNSNR